MFIILRIQCFISQMWSIWHFEWGINEFVLGYCKSFDPHWESLKRCKPHAQNKTQAHEHSCKKLTWDPPSLAPQSAPDSEGSGGCDDCLGFRVRTLGSLDLHLASGLPTLDLTAEKAWATGLWDSRNGMCQLDVNQFTQSSARFSLANTQLQSVQPAYSEVLSLFSLVLLPVRLLNLTVSSLAEIGTGRFERWSLRRRGRLYGLIFWRHISQMLDIPTTSAAIPGLQEDPQFPLNANLFHEQPPAFVANPNRK